MFKLKFAAVFFVLATIIPLASDIATANEMKAPSVIAPNQALLALQTFRPSVYMVGLENADGEFSGVGTAWKIDVSVDIDHTVTVFCSVSHIGELHDELYPGERLVLRSPGRNARDFVVTRALLHPGYGQLTQLFADYQPAYGSTVDSLIPVEPAGLACDVALLFVDGETPGVPLQLASSEDLARMSAMDPLWTIHYPMEGGSIINFNTPSPVFHRGYVTHLTDYLGVPSRIGIFDPEALLVQHSIPAAGGSSGSPIFNAAGKVVAVLSGGNCAMTHSGSRVSSGAGINFAQRIDLVHELLDGFDAMAQAIRYAQWVSALRRSYGSGALVHREQRLAETLENWSARLEGIPAGLNHAELAEVVRQEVQLTGDDVGARGEAAVELPAGGSYLVVAQPLMPAEITLRVDYPAGDVLFDSFDIEESGAIAIAMLEAGSDGRALFHVEGVRSGAVELVVYSAAVRAISAARLMEHLVSRWREQQPARVSAEGESVIVYSTSGSLPTRIDSWDGALAAESVELAAAGDYLAIAIAPNGSDIDLRVLVREEDSLRTLVSDEHLDAYPSCSFHIDQPGEIELRIVGEPTGVNYEVWLVRAVDTDTGD